MAKSHIDKYYETLHDDDGSLSHFNVTKYVKDGLELYYASIDEQIELTLVRLLRQRGWDIRGKHPVATP